MRLKKRAGFWVALIVYTFFLPFSWAFDASTQAPLSPSQRKELTDLYFSLFEAKQGSWKGADAEAQGYAVDYALTQIPNPQFVKVAQQALDAGMEKVKDATWIRRYAEGYAAWSKPEHLKTAKKIKSAGGPISMEGLARLYDVTGDESILSEAIAAAKKASDSGTDNARGFLALYKSTADRQWLKKARSAAKSIVPSGVAFARFSNLLFHYTGDETYKRSADSAFQKAVASISKNKQKFYPDLLLADYEFANGPVHVTVVGEKGDPAAKALFAAALKYPAPYSRIEWWDRKEGLLTNPDIQYPQLPKSAAFTCSNKSCSFPIFSPAEVGATIDRLWGKEKR